jgi:hypothetical protein
MRLSFAWLKSLASRICLLAIVSQPFAVFAQFEAGAVVGTVRDPSGAVVTACQIVLTNTRLNVTRKAACDASGNYDFVNVSVGAYRVTVTATGFKQSQTGEFNVQVDARQRVDVSLAVGETSETVTVDGAASVLETDSSSRGEVVQPAQITDLPLNGRAYADLTLLAPGVTRSALQYQSQYSREASFNVNGQLSTFNSFLLDGIDNNAYSTNNMGFSNQFIQPTPDSLAEFKLETNNFSAEYGRAPGAVINAVIKSGANQFHGSAWEFLRNTNLNAVGFFKPIGGVKPVLIQNQFGASAGGPIRKNSIFLFADYEGFRNVSRTVAFATVPTVAMANGNFGAAVKNPITGEVYSGGQVPAAGITAFAKAVLAGLPAPNLPGNANNYQSFPRVPTESDKGDIRYDEYFGQKATLFVRYSNNNTRLFSPGALPTATPDGVGANGNVYYRNRQTAAGLTWIFGPRTTIEARIGAGYSSAGKSPIGFGQLNPVYTFPNLPASSDLAGGIPWSQLAGGLAALGRQPTSPQYSNPIVIAPKVN